MRTGREKRKGKRRGREGAQAQTKSAPRRNTGNERNEKKEYQQQQRAATPIPKGTHGHGTYIPSNKCRVPLGALPSFLPPFLPPHSKKRICIIAIIDSSVKMAKGRIEGGREGTAVQLCGDIDRRKP